VLPIKHLAFKLAVGNFKKKNDEIKPLCKFLSPRNFVICGEDTISVPEIVGGTMWGSFPVLGSFAVQFEDHLMYWDHLRAGIICALVHVPSPGIVAFQHLYFFLIRWGGVGGWVLLELTEA